MHGKYKNLLEMSTLHLTCYSYYSSFSSCIGYWLKLPTSSETALAQIINCSTFYFRDFPLLKNHKGIHSTVLSKAVSQQRTHRCSHGCYKRPIDLSLYLQPFFHTESHCNNLYVTDCDCEQLLYVNPTRYQTTM